MVDNAGLTMRVNAKNHSGESGILILSAGSKFILVIVSPSGGCSMAMAVFVHVFVRVVRTDATPVWATRFHRAFCCVNSLRNHIPAHAMRATPFHCTAISLHELRLSGIAIVA